MSNREQNSTKIKHSDHNNPNSHIHNNSSFSHDGMPLSQKQQLINNNIKLKTQIFDLTHQL